MSLFPHNHATERNVLGFSLIELLVVIAIMLLLVSLTLPAVNSIVSGRELESAGSRVVEALSSARQTALAKGRRVRWELADIGTAGTPNFSIHRLVEFKDGVWTPVSPWTALPKTVRLVTDPTRSSLINPGATPATSPFTYRGASYANNVIPVTFLPDGTTLLPHSSSSFLTLETTRGPTDGSGRAVNWFAIVINPATGSPQAYRP